MMQSFARAILLPVRKTARRAMREEMHDVLRDIEWRYAQARDLEEQRAFRKLTAEDLDLSGVMLLTGYTTTNNSPVAGSIAWASLHIVYQGVDSAVTDGNTANKYAYWQQATPAVLATSNTKPTLGSSDILVFLNNGGTATVIASDSSSSLPRVLADNTVDNGAVIAGSLTATRLNIAQHLLY